MTRTQTGWSLVIVGAILLVGGAAALATRDSARDLEGSATTTTILQTTTSTAEQTTTTTSPATTTTGSPATTSTVPAETVEEFIAAFATAVEDDDEAFLFARLHPAVIEIYGEDLCQAWISREIVTLSEYRLIGEPEGPEAGTLDTPSGEVEVDVFTAPVSFSFQGQSFDASATLSLIGSEMHWLGECR